MPLGFVALEITPPKKRLVDVLLRRARQLGGLPHAINVIQRPDRLSSLDASLILRGEGFEPVWHVANRGRTRAALASEIESAAAGGLRSVLCLRGDALAGPGPGDAPDTPKLRELIEMMCAGLPGAVVGATANQYGDRVRVLANLLPKLRAGASLVQTNPVFALAPLTPIAEAVKSEAASVRVVPMVMPVLSMATAERIRTRLGLPLPPALIAALEGGGEPAGWAFFRETLAALAEAPFVDGIALMTPEMDPPEARLHRIGQCLSEIVRAS